MPGPEFCFALKRELSDTRNLDLAPNFTGVAPPVIEKYRCTDWVEQTSDINVMRATDYGIICYHEPLGAAAAADAADDDYALSVSVYIYVDD